VYIVHRYRAKTNRVVDGDTVDFEVDLGFHISINIRTRLLGVNTPERGRKDFSRATVMLKDLLSDASDDEGYILIKTEKTGKYGRWLVSIDGVNEVLSEVWPYE
tara:strand:- start:824 stop:1135 length:312 start_codon:yes stop_codon:yes gene_type:complete